MASLPLDSPHWRLWDVVARQYVERSGNLAAGDMERDLKTGALRAMLRRGKPSEGRPEREFLEREFWKDWEFTRVWDTVRARARTADIQERYPAPEFFIWKPDQARGTAEQTERGRPRVHDWERIVIEICWHLATKSEWSKLKQNEFIEKLQGWCKDEFGIVPSADELRARIQKARKRFPRRK